MDVKPKYIQEEWAPLTALAVTRFLSLSIIDIEGPLIFPWWGLT